MNDYNNHYLYEFECYCKENNIVILYIPLHLSHLLQSLDIGYFNILKRSYNKKVENFIRFYINYIIKPDFFIYFHTIFFVIFNEENIRANFQNTSFISFNLKIIISKLDIKLYILISTEPPLTEVNS